MYINTKIPSWQKPAACETTLQVKVLIVVIQLFVMTNDENTFQMFLIREHGQNIMWLLVYFVYCLCQLLLNSQLI